MLLTEGEDETQVEKQLETILMSRLRTVEGVSFVDLEQLFDGFMIRNLKGCFE
jgi:hypothetical protein